ncbi:hypothetical protein PILCRDRAFT_454126 [Piloderma croceum F 1598]|uniref:Secreted protein n=1 Tax=Piloderma croceum (strain F 1598) TaxID=765440 RepID=A0A0C3FSQ7_PILCF|nr:hypothetical protein PILCRDRAFT_454126 [Piloderma croceum F 1598]
MYIHGMHHLRVTMLLVLTVRISTVEISIKCLRQRDLYYRDALSLQACANFPQILPFITLSCVPAEQQLENDVFRLRSVKNSRRNDTRLSSHKSVNSHAPSSSLPSP